MRTKALLLGAMIGAASLATSMAQVYSVNIVGYVNLTIQHGFNMIQNPLNNTGGNTLATVLPTLPVTTSTLYKWDPTQIPPQFLINLYADGWDDDTMPINPGEGFYLMNPTANAYNITFVGEVMTGTLSHTLYPYFNHVASMVPQAGMMQTDLNYQPVGPSETFYQWDPLAVPPQYYIFFWDPSGGWDPEEPTLPVGGSIFVRRGNNMSAWTRQFTVDP